MKRSYGWRIVRTHNIGLPKMPQERLLVTWQGVRGAALRQAARRQFVQQLPKKSAPPFPDDNRDKLPARRLLVLPCITERPIRKNRNKQPGEPLFQLRQA